MSAKWPEVNLGEVLVERREEPDLVAMETGQIRVVEKIPFHSGKLEFRREGKTKTGMITIQPGDLVVSGINAAKGAIAIYDSSEQVPAAATIHYGAYAIKEDRADRRFLWWLLRSNTFREILKDHVPGGIKTELKAKRLLAVPIPLPSLPEQRRIVAKIEQVAAKIGLAHGIHLHATEGAEALVGSFFRRIAADTLATGTLGDVLACPPKNGWSARCDNAEDGTPILTLAAVTGYQYRATEFKRTSMFTKPDAHYWLQPGDLLITRSNTPELVGHAAIYSGAPFPCIYPDLMMRLSPRESAVERRFVWYWLQSPVARDFIERTAKGTSPTMRKISQSNVMGIPFPTSLPLVEQRRIVAKLDALQAQMECLKAFQAQTAAELDALLPSILDLAFQGRLFEAGTYESAKPNNVVPSVPKPNRHFARSLLAAEIVHRLHGEPRFGRIKLQKIFHLCEHIAAIEEIEGQYHREAAGPLDNRLIYTAEEDLKKQKWYEEASRPGFGHTYRALARAGGHRRYAERYWSDKLPVIERLIELMRKWDTERCEILSTVYAAWNDLLIWGRDATDDAIVQEVLEHWHEAKKSIPEERWRKAIAWMRREGFTPTGFGKPTTVANGR